MKTAQQLKVKILQLTSEAQHKETQQKRVKAIKKRLTFLRFCLKYIETNPSEECLKRQLNECEHQIAVYDSRFSDFEARQVKELKNVRQYYDGINGIPKLKEQIRTVNFILSKANP
ncbi:MAG: hypothetical protein PHT07_21090 [Paludibacter sp.]|nr:hypothetical protein [Paludibacter sp.]